MLRSEFFSREIREESLSRGQRFLTLLKTYKRIMSRRPLLVRKVVICLAIASAAPVFGQVINPQGAEYAIIGTAAGDQVNSASAVDANGGYLVWQDNAAPQGLRINAVQLGSSLDAIGTPFLVSSAAKSKTAGD